MFFLDSSTQNHAELFHNCLKKSVLEPNRMKLDQKSALGHVHHVPKVINLSYRIILVDLNLPRPLYPRLGASYSIGSDLDPMGPHISDSELFIQNGTAWINTNAFEETVIGIDIT